MKALVLRWPMTVMAVALSSPLMFGCVAPGGSYGYDQGGFGLGYYDPYGINYGGWGAGYGVGPVRGGVVYRARGGYAGPHAYRTTPGFRSIPSIPSRARSGGFPARGGGGRGGRGGAGRSR